MIPGQNVLARRSGLVAIFRSTRRDVSHPPSAPNRIILMLCGDAQLRVASLKNRRKTTSFSSKVAKHACLFGFIVVGNRDGSPDWPFVGRRGCHV